MKARVPFAGRWDGVKRQERKKTAAILAAQAKPATQATQTEPRTLQGRAQAQVRSCWYCLQEGHVAKTCLLKQEDEKRTEEDETGRWKPQEEPDWIRNFTKACELFKSCGQVTAAPQGPQTPAAVMQPTQAHLPSVQAQPAQAAHSPYNSW